MSGTLHVAKRWQGMQENESANRSSWKPLIVAALLLGVFATVWIPYIQKDKRGEFFSGYQPGGDSEGQAGDANLRGVDGEDPSRGHVNAIGADDPTNANTTNSTAGVSTLVALIKDKANGEPLPSFDVDAHVLGEMRVKVSTRSNSLGRVEWPNIDSAAKVRLQLVDRKDVERKKSSEYVTVDFDPTSESKGEHEGPGPFVLLVDTGPTCFLRMDYPEGYGWRQFVATIHPGPPYQTYAYPAPSRVVPLRKPSIALPNHQLPWVRFPESLRFKEMAWIEVTATDNKWRGGTWLDQTAGMCLLPLVVHLNPATTLQGTFVVDDPSEQDWVRVYLEEIVPESSSRVPRQYSAGGQIEEDNTARILFPNLPTGPMRAVVREKGWHPWSTPITVNPGDNDLGTHALKARKAVGAIRGIVESTSGTYEGACHISLSDEPFLHGGIFDQSLNFEDDGSGKFVAHFEFEGVTAGPWALYVHCHDAFAWPGSLQTVEAPADSIRILLDDRVADLEILAVHAESGLPLGEDVRLDWRCGQEGGTEQGARILLQGQPYPPGRFQFMLYAPGFRPRMIEPAQLLPVSGSHPLTLRGEIPLQPGWGTRLEVRDRTRGGGVGGATVSLNGVNHGMTDKDGVIWLHAVAKPSQIHIEKGGWRWITSLDANAQTGQFTDEPRMRAALVERP